MATFENQVEALTGITISSSGTIPTQDQLSVFLRDAVLDVTRISIAVDPHTTFNFVRDSGKQVSNNSFKSSARIVEVLRETGTEDDWKKARYIIPSDISLVKDKESFVYASKFNPAYTTLPDGLINVFPVPSNNNTFNVYYINDEPVNEDGIELVYSDSTIKYFPKGMVHLVSLYAAIKVLETQMADFNIQEEDFELATTTQQTIEVFKARYQAGLVTSQMAQSAGAGGGGRGGGEASNREIMQTLKGMDDER